MELYHELDPNGDLVLVLDPSALVVDLEVDGIDRPDSPTPAADPESGYKRWHTEVDESPRTESPRTESPRTESPRNEPLTRISSVDGNDNASRTSTNDVEEGQEIRIRVSSKHLTLASCVFASILQPGFSDGDKLLSQGYAELSLPDDNPAALLVLLNLVHGKNKKVPRKVDFRMLTELAVLVDKYDLLEATEMFLDSWFEDLQNNVPQEFNEDLLPWICISWVFKKQEIFERVTKTAQRESDGPIEEYRLPIPGSVLEAISKSRQNTLAELFSYLQESLTRYQSIQHNCPQGFYCDGLMLGTLTIGLFAMGVLESPDPPYNGFLYKTLAQDLRKMRIPQYCTMNHSGYNYNRCPGLEAPLRAKITELEQQLCGLKLASYELQKL